MKTERPDLSVNIGTLKIKNPVIAASGTFGYGDEFSSFTDPASLGAVVVKGLSLRPKAGNPPPRIVETPCGMLNAIGLANIGLDAFLSQKLPKLSALKTVVIANIYGDTVDGYSDVAKGLAGIEGISAIEINISCPNVDQGGMAFGSDPLMAARVTEEVLKNSDKPVIVKLSPNVTDISMIARSVEQAGAHAVSLVNTLTGMAIDVATGRPKLANVSGGLSGPAIRPLALYMVYQVVKAVTIPVIGIGGIMGYKDALEFLIAGARAIQVGTAHFINPRVGLDIIEGLRGFLEQRQLNSIQDIIGTLTTHPRD
ncbi:MAG: dihydroorotate dehydrogenase [Desulfatiglans sp.]|jgi:dihydroorotate dehydrogenase (NAD+) catalytic subunit|nr:dihydroorotate dehydrogenase [Desulfatiglans sp.]